MTAATMPSGVEHLGRVAEDGERFAVTAATMPSGVEHVGAAGEVSLQVMVTAATMPSGVEHSPERATLGVPMAAR